MIPSARKRPCGERSTFVIKIGLVLEGGALRTIYSTGVLDAMLEKDLMADYVVGVSAGIAYGVSYISRQPRRNLEILTRFVNDRRYMGLKNLVDRHNRSYFGLEFSYETIPNELVPFDYDTFAAYPGGVEAVVTNLDTGKAEYMEVPRRDEKFLLLQATCALPLMFPIYYLDGKPYLDGGVADAIPYRRAFEQGATEWWCCSPSPAALSAGRRSSSPSSSGVTASTPTSARPCGTGRRSTIRTGRSCFSWRRRVRPWSLPPIPSTAWAASSTM